jgi:hypothetical protein
MTNSFMGKMIGYKNSYRINSKYISKNLDKFIVTGFTENGLKHVYHIVNKSK